MAVAASWANWIFLTISVVFFDELLPASHESGILSRGKSKVGAEISIKLALFGVRQHFPAVRG
jgi:hypothetical protein